MARARSARRLRWAFGLIGVAVVVLMAYTGYQAVQAKDALESVAAEFDQIGGDLETGDAASARRHLDAAQTAAADASENTQGPGWWLASRLPGVGDDVKAVRTVADVTDELATKVLPPVVDASEVLEPTRLRPRNGRIALAPIEKVAPSVVAADRELQQQEARVSAIDTDALVGQLAAPVQDLQARLGDAAALSGKASYAVRLLPPMLGADKPRTYLMLFQNNAEIRATGGMPGALAVLRANNGKISIESQGTARDLGIHEPPILPLTREEVALYEKKLGIFAADINFTPDFPRTAELARAMLRATRGKKVDGVLAADPVALSYLLKGTGPVAVPGGPKLSAGNAVDVLLSDIYRHQPDPELQNSFFALSARAVFDAVTSGKGRPDALLEGLNRSASEGRLYAWSSVPKEQRLLAETSLGGVVPREDGASPYVGVFFNDGTAAKMEYYLDHRVDVKPVSCNTSGRQRLEVTVTLTSHAPADARNLPVSVIGPREGGQAYFGVRPGNMRFNAYLYAPIGGWFEDSAVDGQELALAAGEHLGHPVGSTTVELAPGQTRKLTYTVMSGLHQTGDVKLRVTPGVRTSGVGQVQSSACSVS